MYYWQPTYLFRHETNNFFEYTAHFEASKKMKIEWSCKQKQYLDFISAIIFQRKVKLNRVLFTAFISEHKLINSH